MTKYLLLAALAAIPTHVFAEDILSTATGNWAGESNQGYYFRAELYDNGDFVGLRICQSLDAAPATCTDDQAELNNREFQAHMTIGVNLKNTLIANLDGTLTVYAAGDDESYSFSEYVVVQMMDNQFTVMGYHVMSLELATPDGTKGDVYACEVDVWNDRAAWTTGQPTWTGAGFEDKNASQWHPQRATELGMCPAVG
jgi:hypothetical protein